MPELYHIVQLPLFPDRRCPRCTHSYPATADYFNKCKSQPPIGLYPYCKNCTREIDRERKQNGKRNDTYITLICAYCGEEFQREIGFYNGRKKREGERFYCCKEHEVAIRREWAVNLAEEYLQGQSMLALARKYNKKNAASITMQLTRMGVPLRQGNDRMVNGNPMQGVHHTEEARVLMSQHMIKRLIEGSFSPVSKLEDRVALELERLGISFTRQYPIYMQGRTGRVAILDFMLADGRGVEVNGTYWHCDPRVYPDGPISDTQRGGIERDKRKQQALAELNIPLIILWEIDLNADMPGTIERALSTHVLALTICPCYTPSSLPVGDDALTRSSYLGSTPTGS